MGIDKDKVHKSEFEEKLLQNMQSNLDAEQEEKTIPVIEEKVKVDKKIVEKGKVHVSKQVHEEEVTVDEPFIYEEVDVKRVAMNISLDKKPEVRYEGDTMIIPVVKEEVVVQKRLVLVEELHITKRKVEEHHPQQVTLRKEDVRVERSDNNK